MSGQTYERPVDEPLTDLSASRIHTVDRCSLAFRYQYVDRIPAPTEGAGALFGNVIHDALHGWYGEPDSENHRNYPLADYVREQWRRLLPPEVSTVLQRCLVLDEALDDVAGAILLARPTLKAPRMTKTFLDCDEMKLFEDQRDELLRRCERVESVRWPKDENPIQAYRKSMTIAQQLQARWGELPRPMVVEHPFRIELDGFSLKGRIDQVRNDPLPTGQVFTNLLDVKTGRQLFTQMDAFIQAFVYDEACYQDPELPTPDFVTFFNVRHNKEQIGKIERERHRALALRILNGVARTIITADYQPHYGPWCRICDYAGLCEREISLWPAGTDSLTMEVA